MVQGKRMENEKYGDFVEGLCICNLLERNKFHCLKADGNFFVVAIF